MAQDAVKYKMVVIGGSAGSLDIILKIVPLLPSHSNASFLIVVHRKNDVDSILTRLLSTRTTMKVTEVDDKLAIQPNSVYIAPPDYHLLVESNQLFSLDNSEKVHYSRPSIDVSFESVAEAFGPYAIGVLLSGANADGASGLHKIKAKGGYAIVQNPASAYAAFMPQQALNLGPVNAVVNGDELPEYIKGLLGT